MKAIIIEDEKLVAKELVAKITAVDASIRLNALGSISQHVFIKCKCIRPL